ncbi:MAG TPA: signal recognition particle-docking protein FtsY [Methylomirabilota bacterium]|nr:signal recognition particle-docking protein FtsY [Methylomirabilota bacterium]
MKFFSALTERVRESLNKTREAFQEGFDRVFKGEELTPATLEELEELLLQADLGVETTEAFIEAVRDQARRGRLTDGDVRESLAAHLRDALKGAAAPLALDTRPAVLLVLGVNGSGKTTTCGKLAWALKRDGSQVLLAAADTFRAAAIEQLERWGDRVGAPVVKQGPGADPSAVAFDAVKAAQARQADALIVDTAGRLHTKTNLMAELQKVKRVIGRQLPGAPHETLLVLDATTGQNGIAQARLFHEALTLTGLILTKLDGTAKGGIVVRIARELGLPIKLVATGERPEDLAVFDPETFVAALVSA